MLNHLFLIVLALLLTSCSGQPHKAKGERSLTPKEAVVEFDSFKGVVVEWGGRIVSITNRANQSQLEIISYPLDNNGKPLLEKRPQGRFIATSDEYLESADYRKGRRVTLNGPITALHEGAVGEARYTFPHIAIDSITLWPLKDGKGKKPDVRFNLGIGVGSRGTNTNIGIGIGF